VPRWSFCYVLQGYNLSHSRLSMSPGTCHHMPPPFADCILTEPAEKLPSYPAPDHYHMTCA
jgi:hypothetical protein